MKLLSIVILGCLAASLSWADDALARDYSGKYKSKITPSSGDPVKATVTIIKIDERVYTTETKYADFKETAICFAEEDRLSCGFTLKSAEHNYIGVSIYRPREDGKLIGEWVETIGKQPGKEVLTPVAD